MHLYEVGKVVRARRLALGLTQQRLAKLASLSRQTVQRLEAGTIKDLSFQRVLNLLGVIGLNFSPPSTAARGKKHGLWMAAQTCSVSYRGELTGDQLRQALATGQAPAGNEPHLRHFLDEAPVSVVVMAVEEAAQLEGVPPAQIWAGVSKLESQLGSNRGNIWR